jgi:amphiphysin
MAGHAYKAAVDELDAGVGRELVRLVVYQTEGFSDAGQDAPFRATVLEPIGKLNSYYGQINAAIDKRNHKVSHNQ